MPTSIASNTLTATAGGTEDDLATDTAGHTYVLKVDTAAMVLGDVIELRLYDKCLSGGTERLAYVVVYQHVQGDPMKLSPPLPADIHIRATLKQISGSARTFPWKLLSL
jgi:hypothetical protein